MMLLENVERVHDFLSLDFITELSKRGVRTVSDFQRYDPEKIVEISHESKCELKETLNTVFKFRRHLFISHASSCDQSWYSTSIKSNILRTRIKEFDAIFNWGFKGGFIYEVYGMPGTGRTQLSLYLTATNALNGGNTLYIDTKNDFCIDRFCEILSYNHKPQNEAKRIKLNCDKNEELVQSYLNKIRLAKIFSIQSLLTTISSVVKNLSDLTSENSLSPENWKFYRNIKLLVIDNIASIVLPLLGNERYPMSDITAFTSEIIDKLREVAVNHKIIVLVVNNIVANNSTYTRNFKDSSSNANVNEPSYKPSLGKLFCDAADIRFRMSHLSTNKKVSNIPNQKRNTIREVVVEKDQSRSDNKKIDKVQHSNYSKRLRSL